MRKSIIASALPERKGIFEKSADGVNYRLTFRDSASGRRIAFQVLRDTTVGPKWCTLSGYYKNINRKVETLFSDELFFLSLD